MFCPECGASNEDDSIFCGNCGAVLDADQAPAEAIEEQASDPVTVEGELEDSAESSQPEDAPAKPAPPAPPPAYPPHPSPSVPTSGMAIASLVLGIGGLTVLPLLGSIAAIILGYMARRDIRQRPDQLTGDGLALAGIVLGWISVALALVGIVVLGGITVCGICGALGANY